MGKTVPASGAAVVVKGARLAAVAAVAPVAVAALVSAADQGEPAARADLPIRASPAREHRTNRYQEEVLRSTPTTSGSALTCASRERRGWIQELSPTGDVGTGNVP